MSLCNKTFGIIGLGSIGKEVAVRLSSFKVKLLAFDIYCDKDFASRHGVEYTDLDTLLRLSDIVSLHIPVFLIQSFMINSASLQKMKKARY